MSFDSPFTLCTAIDSIGGSEETTLKKLKGAMFNIPSSDCVVTNAIGLGITDPINNL